MSMTQLSDYRWRFRLTYRKKSYSLYYEAPTTLTKAQAKKEAKNQYNIWETDIKAGRYIKEIKICMNDLIQEVYNVYVLTQLKESTQLQWEMNCTKYVIPYFKNSYVNDVTPLDIQHFSNFLSKSLTHGSVKNILGIVSTIFKFAVKWGYISESPYRFIEVKKDRKQTNTQLLTLEEVNTLVNYYITEEKNKQHKSIFLLAIGCGLRISEIRALTLDDIDFTNKIISINKQIGTVRTNEGKRGRAITSPKTVSSTRAVYAPDFVISAIKDYINSLPALPISKQLYYSDRSKYNVIETSTIDHFFKTRLKKLGLPEIRFHDLRHLNATLLVSNNINIKSISARLGHAKVDTTLNIYTSATQEEDKLIAHRLDEIFQNLAKTT